MNILIVQYGDYADAYLRLKAGGEETYRDQRASVEYVESLSETHSITIVAITENTHDIQLTPTLRSIGIPYSRLKRPRSAAIFSEVKPDLFICSGPNIPVLEEAKKRGVKTLPCLADIMSFGGLRQHLWNLRAKRALTAPTIPCVSNHSLNATQSLVDVLGIPKMKAVPWDWSRLNPISNTKASISSSQNPTAFYAGMVTEDKGVGDCIEAVRILRDRGIKISMAFAGRGDVPHWQARAEEAGVSGVVDFLGLMPHPEVRNLMRTHDLVLVPTHHSYAEGLPNTIYEALASRTPLIISDHPAFMGRIEPDKACVTCQASNPDSLADAIARVITDKDLYRRLSENSETALSKLYVGLEWEDLISKFMADPDNKTNWVEENSLATLGY